MKYYVYTLARPDGMVFYVGKGSGNRIAQHEKEALRGHNCPKCDLIRSIWRQGGSVQRSIVFETDDEQEALDHEAELIRAYGYNRLVNRNGAGTGGAIRRARVAHWTQDDTTCANLVDQLFKTHLRPDGREYSYLEVAAALGGELDASLIGRLRSGKTKNPTRTTMLCLCQFFQVPASYFFPEVEAILTHEATPGRQLAEALRALGLKPEHQVLAHALILALANNCEAEA